MTNGWFFKEIALTSSYKEESFSGSAKNIKMKVVGGNCEFSFSGQEADGKIVDADLMQDFLDVNKGKIYVKGTGTVTVMAWDGA